MIDVAGAFLSAFLGLVFDRTAPNDILEFLGGNHFDKEPFEKLTILLLSVKAVLSDAEEKQIVDSNVKAWINEVREAIYLAEDISDEINTNALIYQGSSKSKFKGKIRELFSSVNPRVEKINERLSFVVDLKHVLGLKEAGQVGNVCSLSLPTTCLLPESEVFGRDVDKDEILNFILAGDKHGESLSVVAIVGMVGIGKTTLSQLLFNDERVKEGFYLRLWVHVSEGCGVFEVTKRIYESVTSSNRDIRDLNLLQIMLKVELKFKLNGKRLLLVLDDFYVENYFEWELLKRSLAEAAQGVILVTTRNEKVSSIMSPSLTHFLQLLSPEDCWNVFAHHSLRGRKVEDNPIISEIGKKIVERCDGLPLATKALGILLNSVDNVMEWENMLKSKIWEHDKINIFPALKHCYQQLPLHLKRCFSYCSLLPKGCDITKQVLILLWMAEGLLPSSKNGKTMEEVGDEYFNELLSRSLLQCSMSDDSSFLMHDLMRELAQYAAGEFFLRLEDENSDELPKKVRHLSFLQDKIDISAKLKAIQGISHLRTLLPFKSSRFEEPTSFSKANLDVLLKCLVHLRVLSLSNFSIYEIPDLIAKLRYLRHLNLSHTQIKVLPDSIVSLFNLRALLLNCCDRLIKLPTKLSNLINLRHLDARGTKLREMPPNFSRFKFLQLTSFFVSPNNGSSISELGELLQLHVLSIVNLENLLSIDAPKANLKEKKFLEELELKWTSPIDAENVLASLQPHMYLRKLKIANYGGRRFPSWFANSSLPNIMSIHLTGCRDCVSLPQLGQLTSLKILRIAGMTNLKRVDDTFYGSHSRLAFRSLKILSFEDMSEWEDWLPVEENEFPSLEELYIRKCGNLRGNLSSRNLPALNKLVISECHSLVDPLPKVPMLQELEISDCNALESLPDEMMKGNECLTKVVIHKCPNLQSFPKDDLPAVLKSLDIRFCGQLKLLPDVHADEYYPALELLNLQSSCHSLTSFPLSFFPALQDLHIQDCHSLVSISATNRNFCCLKRLQVQGCSNLMSFPDGVLPPPNLRFLEIVKCENLTPPAEWGRHVLDLLGTFRIES